MKWLVINGPQRTGSTAVYNALRLATGSAIGLVEPWVMDRISRVRPECPTAVKVHDWRPVEVPETCAVVLTIRHPLDVEASRVRHPEREALGTLETALAHYAHWETRDAFWFVYERFYNSPSSALHALFGAFGLDVDWERMTRIIHALSPEETRRRSLAIEPGGLDPETELRHAHVSETLGLPGAWRDVLTKEQAQEILSRVGPWFDMGGYDEAVEAAA